MIDVESVCAEHAQWWCRGLAASMPMPNILIVDGSEAERTLAGDILSAVAGQRCFYAENGWAALELVRSQPIDIVITALCLPEMNGLELLKALQAEFPLLPVVVVTSRGSEEVAVAALQSGAASYIPKRRLQRTLADTVAEVLRSARQQRQRCVILRHRLRERLTLELENDRDLISPAVQLLADLADEFGALDGSDHIRVRVALEEALVNAVVHGNLGVSSELRERDDDAYEQQIAARQCVAPFAVRRVRIDALAEPGCIEYVIEDQGDGFDVASLPDPTDPANLWKCSGRGILLMRSFMDEVQFSANGRCVRMTKSRRPALDNQDTDSMAASA